MQSGEIHHVFFSPGPLLLLLLLLCGASLAPLVELGAQGGSRARRRHQPACLLPAVPINVDGLQIVAVKWFGAVVGMAIRPAQRLRLRGAVGRTERNGREKRCRVQLGLHGRVRGREVPQQFAVRPQNRRRENPKAGKRRTGAGKEERNQIARCFSGRTRQHGAPGSANGLDRPAAPAIGRKDARLAAATAGTQGVSLGRMIVLPNKVVLVVASFCNRPWRCCRSWCWRRRRAWRRAARQRPRTDARACW